jgi:Flp pilus assembly protein TadD
MAQAITPKEMASLLVYGNNFFEYGQYDQAEAFCRGILLFDQKNAYAHAMLGALEQKKTNFASAVEHYSSAIDSNGRNTNTLTNRGECYLNLGRFEDAAVDLKAAMELDPTGKDPSVVRARFLTSLSVEALKLAKEKGTEAVLSAKRRLNEQLS